MRQHVHPGRGLAALMVCLAATAVAGPARAAVPIMIEYLRVPAAEEPAFVRSVHGPVRDASQTLMTKARLYAWYHYAVRLPLGDEAPYNHVMVNVFADDAAVEQHRPPYARFLANREIFTPVRDARSEGYGSVPDGYTHITVDYIHVPDACRQVFFEHVTQSIKPGLAKRIEAGTLVNWSLFAKISPAGDDRRYDVAAVTRYPSFADVEQPLFADLGNPCRDTPPALVKSELWSTESVLLAPPRQP